MVNYVGYTRRVFDALGSTRPVASWGSEPSALTGDQQEIMDFLSDAFTQIVPPGEEQLYNKLTPYFLRSRFIGWENPVKQYICCKEIHLVLKYNF
ncbi:MAG: hypothetical protein V7K48_03670 [Nostoc sp.]|uniref:hypothetical protein n=1 Tax=Nostoc sp. TaxID=1180 RepID=UPI002FF895C3